MYVFSLDPSLSSTGYAVIESTTNKLITKGRITTSTKDDTDTRIQYILQTLIWISENHNVQDIILEDGFVGFNAGGSLKLAELRGAIIAYYKYKKYTVVHRQPKEIRKNFGLSGSAKKEEVANEVLKYYPELQQEIGPYSDKANKQKTSDIYDAISIGLSYILQLKE